MKRLWQGTAAVLVPLLMAGCAGAPARRPGSLTPTQQGLLGVDANAQQIEATIERSGIPGTADAEVVLLGNLALISLGGGGTPSPTAASPAGPGVTGMGAGQAAPIAGSPGNRPPTGNMGPRPADTGTYGTVGQTGYASGDGGSAVVTTPGSPPPYYPSGRDLGDSGRALGDIRQAGPIGPRGAAHSRLYPTGRDLGDTGRSLGDPRLAGSVNAGPIGTGGQQGVGPAGTDSSGQAAPGTATGAGEQPNRFAGYSVEERVAALVRANYPWVSRVRFPKTGAQRTRLASISGALKQGRPIQFYNTELSRMAGTMREVAPAPQAPPPAAPPNQRTRPLLRTDPADAGPFLPQPATPPRPRVGPPVAPYSPTPGLTNPVVPNVPAAPGSTP